MASRSLVLPLLLLLPLVTGATAAAPACSATHGHAPSAPACSGSGCLTAHGQPPAAGTAGPQVGSSTLEFNEEEKRLLRELEKLMREGSAARELAERVEHVRRVLDYLGYREMAAAAPYLGASPVVASWPGPFTIFAVPDEILEASCPGCPRETSLVEHAALGAFTFGDLSTKHMRKVASAMVGMCFTATLSAGDARPTISINGVKIGRPDLYNDGRLIVHGVEGVVASTAQGSCYNTKSITELLSRADLLNLVIGMVRNANMRE